MSENKEIAGKTDTVAKTDDGALPAGAPVITDETLAKGAPKKTIEKTFGGKLMHALTYYGLGWIGNSGLALFFTYSLNPKPKVVAAKNRLTASLLGIDGSPEKIQEIVKHSDVGKKVRSAVEIIFMYISGTIMTLAMTPMVKYQDKLAYKINQLFGKDKDVLPEDMQPHKAPETQKEVIEQELKKRVRSQQTAGDLWKARLVMMGAILWGDNKVTSWNHKVENMGGKSSFLSTDKLGWIAGTKLHNALHRVSPKLLNRWVEFFQDHGAALENIQNEEPNHFRRMAAVEIHHGEAERTLIPSEMNRNRMVIAEQTRLVTKEMSWTMVMAACMDYLTSWFNGRRVKKQQSAAIADLREKGILTNDYDVLSTVDGDLRVVERNPAPKDKSFAAGVEPKKMPVKRSVMDMAERNEGQEASVSI